MEKSCVVKAWCCLVKQGNGIVMLCNVKYWNGSVLLRYVIIKEVRLNNVMVK